MLRLLAVFLVGACASVCLAQSPSSVLKYVPAPADNPLKGLVPYARPAADRFPHSLEFNYLPLSDLVVGENQYDWQPLEKLLDDIASRGNQSVFRIWIEYPGHKNGIPAYLERSGLKVTQWLNTNTDPFPRQQVRTPDYEDPKLRSMLKSFIAAMGKKYDGDPRIGYITAGLLGTWGEWHTYPRDDLMASKKVQTEVMDAYESAFKVTPVLLRYPAGNDAWAHAANDSRSFGYHDDSFAWATLDTGRKEDNWFFLPAMKSAGQKALEKWKTRPIGGEIRPELWGQIFDDRPQHAQAQDFDECVRQTHATWLMDTGMFQERANSQRLQNAIKKVQRLGYEFHIESVNWKQQSDGSAQLELNIKNTGIAPFYYNWRVQLACLDGDKPTDEIKVDWSITGLQPGERRTWRAQLVSSQVQTLKSKPLAVRVVNPLAGGHPLRFANEYPKQSNGQWWPIPNGQ